MIGRNAAEKGQESSSPTGTGRRVPRSNRSVNLLPRRATAKAAATISRWRTDKRLRGRRQTLRLIPCISISLAGAYCSISGDPKSRFPSINIQSRSVMTEGNVDGSIGPSHTGSGLRPRQAETRDCPMLATSCWRGDAPGGAATAERNDTVRKHTVQRATMLPSLGCATTVSKPSRQ